MHELLAGFPDVRAKRLEDYERSAATETPMQYSVHMLCCFFPAEKRMASHEPVCGHCS